MNVVKIEPAAKPIGLRRPSAPVPYRAIFFLALAAFVTSATQRVASPLLPQIAADFGVTVGTAATILVAQSTAFGVMQIFFGAIGDRFGKYVVVTIGTFLSALAIGASVFCVSLEQLTVANLTWGFVAAGIITLSLAFVGDSVAYHDRQTTLARFATATMLGVMFGQAAGGVLGEIFSWRHVFAIVAALYCIAWLLLLVELTRDPALRVRGEPKPIMATFTQLAALLRQPWPRTVLLAVFIESAFGFGLLSYVSPDLQLRFGIGPGAAGGIMAAHGLGGITYALSARFMVLRFGEAGLARLGGLLAAIQFASLIVIPSPWFAIGFVAVSGVGLVMLHNTLQVNASQLAPEARGTAMSLFATCLFGGMMIGIAAMAPIFDRYGAKPIYAVSALVLPALAFWFSFKLKTRPQLIRG